MTDLLNTSLNRRAWLGGALAGGTLLAVPGCATLPGFSFTDAIRRVLTLSSERAFARLVEPGGYWDEQVGRVGLGNYIGGRGDVISSILTSALFKDRLEDAFAGFAARGARRAAPIVADTVRVIGIENAVALVRGGPTAATSFLRGEMGNGLVEAMVPEIGEAMRVAREPLVGQLLGSLTGVNVTQVAGDFSDQVNSAIWNEIGFEEAAIRRDPESTNDPVIIGVFGAGSLL